MLKPQNHPNPQWPTYSYPIYKPLVELLHGSLKLAALELPLLIIPDRLQSWSLPCRRSGEVVNVINPPHVVNSALPALGKKDKPQLSIAGNLRAQRHLEVNVVEGNRKHGLIISFFSSAKIMQELELFYENHFYLLHTIQRETHSIYCIFTFLKIVFKSCLDHCPYCAGITAVIPSSPIIQACWFLLKYSNSPDILSYSTQDFPTLICQKRKVWTWGLVFCFDFSLGFFFYL